MIASLLITACILAGMSYFFLWSRSNLVDLLTGIGFGISSVVFLVDIVFVIFAGDTVVLPWLRAL